MAMIERIFRKSLAMLYCGLSSFIRSNHHRRLHSSPSNYKFNYVYDIGLILTVIMLVVRGITQVLAIDISKGFSASISGVAGIGHILIAIGFISLLLSFKKACE